MYTIPSKINLLSKIFSISDFPLMEKYWVILSMHLSTRVKNNVATSSSGSWNTKAILFRLGLGFFYNVFRWKVWVRKNLEGYIHQHLTKTSSMWNSILQWLCLKECLKEFSLATQTSAHISGSHWSSENKQKSPPNNPFLSWSISCNFLTSTK